MTPPSTEGPGLCDGLPGFLRPAERLQPLAAARKTPGELRSEGVGFIDGQPATNFDGLRGTLQGLFVAAEGREPETEIVDARGEIGQMGR